MAAPAKLASLFVLTIGLVLATCNEPNFNVTQPYGLELLGRACKSLLNALSFLNNVKSSLTLDAMLGVVIVREQSASLLRLLEPNLVHWPKPNSQLFFVKRQLIELHKRSCEVSTAMPFARHKAPHYFREIGGILSRTIWSKVSCHLKTLSLNKSAQHHSVPANFTLNESVSDICLAEVLDGCRISTFCWTLFTEFEYEGYSLAHQVFYVTVAKSMNCLMKMSPSVQIKVEQKIDSLCSSMYKANLKNEAKNYPSEDHDLFMENIAFCGLNAFKPFRDRYRWLEEIMQWQSLHKGCFTVDLRKLARLLDGHPRSKRRERVLANGCGLHKTSMALASISVYVQELIIQWLKHSLGQFDCESTN